MIVAFRTRPPLLNEAADKFHANPDAKEALVDAEGQTAAVEFCAGITLTSAEPGVFVAHVPGMKVTSGCLTSERV
jgi:kinesin family protein 2/24